MASKRILEQYQNVIVDSDTMKLISADDEKMKIYSLYEIFRQHDGKAISLTVEYYEPIKGLSIERVGDE